MTKMELEVKIETLEQKIDALMDMVFMIHAAEYPDAAYQMVEFADGSGRFLPADTNNKGDE